MRQFVETEIMPHRDDWDAAGKIPVDLYRKAGKIGLLSAVLGWPEESPIPRPEGYDGFFTMIAVDELCRCGSGGIVWGLVGGFGIGLPPLHYSGEQAFMKDIVKKCLLGEKRICLAISEAQAGCVEFSNERGGNKTDEGGGRTDPTSAVSPPRPPKTGITTSSMGTRRCV